MASTAEPLWGDAYARANREPDFGRARRCQAPVVIATLSRSRVPRQSPRASRAADLHIPILGQLAPAEFALGDALEAGPLEVVGSDMPLGLGSPAKEAVCDTVQSLRGSKPGTGTAVDISLPSIRNTRPCDADSRTFNAS